ncbi:hypothetical protein BGZ63DRAFT_457214 [Mariannaea sp. PMI_226]|nr:hypothetical protein BGZ63DRAFT_457214 [Mariannaea sp. PMI_226]
MAEIVGLVASCTALLQLVKYASKFAHALSDAAHDAGSATQDMANFSDQVFTFSHAIDLTCIALRRHYMKYKESHLLAFLTSHQVMDDLERDTRNVQSRILKANRRLNEEVISKYTIITAVRWMYQKKTIKILLPQMERIKTLLALILLIAIFETISLDAETIDLGLQDTAAEVFEAGDEGLKREIRQMKRAIKSQLNQLKRIESRIQRQASGHLGPSYSRNSINSWGGGHETLVNLSKSVVKTGRIPEERIPEDSRTEMNVELSLPSDSQDTRRRSHPTPDPESLTRAESRGSQTSVPERLVIKADPRYWNKTIGVLVSCSDGQKQKITAVLAREMEVNILSHKKALELRVKVKRKWPDRAVWLDFGDDGAGASMGTVEIHWTRNDRKTGNALSAILKFEVSEHCPQGMILGAPFVQGLWERRERLEA